MRGGEGEETTVKAHTEVMVRDRWYVADLLHSVDLPSIQIETLVHLPKPPLTWRG